MNADTLNFILSHPEADTSKLLLSAAKYPGIDIPTAAKCIEARKKLKEKVPSWYSCGELRFPYPTAMEQCSSEAAARYKQRFVPQGATVADLTAGLGVDTYFLSFPAASVECFEHNPSLAEATRENLRLLGRDNVTLTEGDSSALPDGRKHFDLIYLDPDRRSASGKRLYDIRECEPDITTLKDRLFTVTDRILVKISPMADITATLRLLPETSEVHVVSVDDECKEVLLLMERDFSGEPSITAADIDIAGGNKTFSSTLSRERELSCRHLTSGELEASEGLFLFRPCRAMVKAGFLKTPAERFALTKIGSDVHLYLGREPLPEFPGKAFLIEKVLPFNGKMLKTLSTFCPAASVTARNFPLSSEELHARARLKEDDTRHIFAFRLDDGSKYLVITTRISVNSFPIG